jgi:hypothetical protein
MKLLARSRSLVTRAPGLVAFIYLERGNDKIESRTTMGFAATALASMTKGASEERSNMARLGFSELAQARGLSGDARSA